MSRDVLIAIHGYHPTVGGRDVESVMGDRFTAAKRTADAFSALGADVTLVFLGGHGNDDDQTIDDPAKFHQYAADHHPRLLDSYPHERAEGRVGNTREDMVALTEFIRDSTYTPEFVVNVSSKDHVPRIQRLWAELQNTGIADDSYIATAVASDETYAANGFLPFILEAARFEDFLGPFNELWNINPDDYADAAADVSEVLQKYQ